STYNLAFSYDRYGNMTCTQNQNTSGPCPQNSFNSSTNRITTSGFTYDAAGDLTSDGSNIWQYDAEGRQSSANGNFQTYNALGQFVSNPVPWTVFYYMYDPWGNRVGDSESNGEIWAQMVPIIGESWSVYSVDNAQMYFPHPNLLGSTTGDTDETGTAVGDVLYYPWGTTWTYAGNILWGSHFSAFDSNGFTARLYDTTPGRWYNPDPVGGDLMNPQSLNRYAYALNDPTSLTDPLGLDSCSQTVNSDLSVSTSCTVTGGGSSPSNNPLSDLANQGVGNLCSFGTALCGSSLIVNFNLPPGCRIVGNPIREICSGAAPPAPAPPPAPSLVLPPEPTPPNAQPQTPLRSQPTLFQQASCSVTQASQDAKELFAIDDAIAPIESRVVPAAGMIVAGGGVAATSLALMDAMPTTIPIALPVFASGVAMAAEGGYYGVTGHLWPASNTSCQAGQRVP
ncbi:MAG: RHS repeat-associated core domain-containing protein, partial [Gammaproteobacteria bacterium]